MKFSSKQVAQMGNNLSVVTGEHIYIAGGKQVYFCFLKPILLVYYQH